MRSKPKFPIGSTIRVQLKNSNKYGIVTGENSVTHNCLVNNIFVESTFEDFCGVDGVVEQCSCITSNNLDLAAEKAKTKIGKNTSGVESLHFVLEVHYDENEGQNFIEDVIQDPAFKDVTDFLNKFLSDKKSR